MPRPSAPQSPLHRPHVGALAPEIDLVTPDGVQWSLKQQRGHATIVIFHRHAH